MEKEDPLKALISERRVLDEERIEARRELAAQYDTKKQMSAAAWNQSWGALQAAVAHANKMFTEAGSDTAYVVEHTPSCSADVIGGARFHLKHGRNVVANGSATAMSMGSLLLAPKGMNAVIANKSISIENADERFWRSILLDFAKAGILK